MAARIACVLTVLIVTTYAATARDAKIGAVTVDLMAPQGYCELVESNASDARTLNAIRTVLGSQTDLLAMYADCAQHDGWRGGTRPLLDDFVQYQAIASLKNANLEAAGAIAEACKTIRAQAGQSMSETLAEFNKRAALVLNGVKFNETKFLGVAAEDDTACYAALLQKLTTEVGTEKTQAILLAITVAKARAVHYVMYTPYAGADMITRMLARHKINVAAFLAANKR